MTLDLSEIIDKIKTIETAFNTSDDPTERYALLQALNHIGEKEIPIHNWMESKYYNLMLEAHGAKK